MWLQTLSHSVQLSEQTRAALPKKDTVKSWCGNGQGKQEKEKHKNYKKIILMTLYTVNFFLQENDKILTKSTILKHLRFGFIGNSQMSKQVLSLFQEDTAVVVSR